MAIGVSIDFRGDAGLQSAFNALTGPKQKKATRKGLRAGAKLMADRARQLVPVGKKGTDAHKAGTLRKSIKVRAIKRTRRFAGMVVTTGGARAKDEFYGVWTEYGTAKQPPQPFLRPAFDSLKDQAAELSRKEIGTAVERIWRTGK